MHGQSQGQAHRQDVRSELGQSLGRVQFIVFTSLSITTKAHLIAQEETEAQRRPNPLCRDEVKSVLASGLIPLTQPAFLLTLSFL